jgi:hypothetical protein
LPLASGYARALGNPGKAHLDAGYAVR